MKSSDKFQFDAKNRQWSGATVLVVIGLGDKTLPQQQPVRVRMERKQEI
jgi:hypothetical protein